MIDGAIFIEEDVVGVVVEVVEGRVFLDGDLFDVL